MTQAFEKFSVIAEIGVNHEGDFAQAEKMLRLAAGTGVDFVKFQSFTPARYASASDAARLARVTRMALSPEQFRALADVARSLGVGFISTPLSEDWVDILNDYCPAFKIASGDITFRPVIQKAARTGKPLIISTGAATLEEIDQAVGWVEAEIGKDKVKDRLILLHCVTAYPTPVEHANVLSVPFLKERYGLRAGYSNHVMGINASLAAVALGADVIEVHFTDQKEGREFRDHSLSFDQADLADFLARAKEIRASLGVYGKVVQPSERDIVPAVRKGIIAARALKAGQVLKPDDLMYARPATEFTSADFDRLIGKTINEDVPEGHLIPRKAI